MNVLSQLRFIAILAVLIPPCARAADRWISLYAGGFELYTNGTEKAGRQALERLDRIRQVFGAVAGARSIQPIPVRIFLFRSANDYKPFRPTESTAAFYQSGPQRDYIVMHSATGETYRIAYHEYVHLALSHSTVRLPRWLEEGTAEFYSTLEIDGETLYTGRAIPAHLYTLSRSEWLGGRQLLSVGRDSPYYNEVSKAGIFYAQSWALVHMLNLADPYRKSIHRFISLIAGGAPQEAAMEQAFGRNIDALMTDLRLYLQPGRLPHAESPAQPLERMEKPVVMTLSEAAAELAAVDLLVQLGREDEAGKRLRQAARQMPGAPEIETGIGLLALRQRKYVEARQHLGWAIAGGSRDASTYFEYAMLLRETRGPAEEVEKNLRRSIELNPAYAEPRFLLAVALTQKHKAAEAVTHLEEATRILPRQAYFWQALSVAYSQLDRKADARQAAQRALDAAQTRHEAEMAQAAIALVENAGRVREEARARRPDVLTPRSWSPKQGGRRITGLLEQIDCLGESARLHVLMEEGRLALFVRNPGEVLLTNASSLTFTFRCGPQAKARIT
ncbi:MAG: hypothetical protein NTY38_23730, partial [Acidobacteria bacterium]|nr:hypothetical protein [Acidobacteriota bacterium]